tara:strand:+ start:558 stop:1181 length:624 start_codon:yes stop_codon:yes gene_type:complete
MQEKEVYLKRNSFLILFLLSLFFLLIIKIAKSEENENKKLVIFKLSEYLKNVSEFSSRFIQTSEGDLQEGKFYLKNNRLRIDYETPNNIIIIVKKNNAMYFNVDLEEVQYFNPKNTIAEIFFELFYDSDFFNDAIIISQENSYMLTKNYIIKDQKNQIEIFFEKTPLIIRKIKVTNPDGETTFGIIDVNYNPNLNDKIFSLANPLSS